MFNRDINDCEIKQREIPELNFFYPVRGDRESIDKKIRDALESVFRSNKLRTKFEVEFYNMGFIFKNTIEIWKITTSLRDATSWEYNEKLESLKKELNNISQEIVSQNIGNGIGPSTDVMFRVSE